MEEEKNYCVYKHICPDGMIYVGMTQDWYQRCFPSQYRKKPFIDWIEYFGWDNIIHEVIIKGLTKSEAMAFEDFYITYYQNKGKSLNTNRSGNYLMRKEKEKKEFIEKYGDQIMELKEEKKRTTRKKWNLYRKEKSRQFLSTPEGKIYNRVASFNLSNPDKITEKPIEAKKKYLESGYIPSYIKNDDLI